MTSGNPAALFTKLLPLIHRFVMLRQGGLSQMYVGRLLEVDRESVQLQTYHSDGQPAAQWTINLSTITEFVSHSRQLDMLALKVKWAASPDNLADDQAHAKHQPSGVPLAEVPKTKPSKQSK